MIKNYVQALCVMPRARFQSLREMPRHFAKWLNCLGISRNAWLHRLPVTYILCCTCVSECVQFPTGIKSAAYVSKEVFFFDHHPVSLVHI